MSDRVFVFDAREGRALVHSLDGEAPLGLVRLGPLLAHLRDRRYTVQLRQFAADVAGGLPHANARLVEAAQRAAHEEARGDSFAARLAAVRSALSGAATAASSVGLRHGASNAASFLSGYEACAPDAFDAAVGASRMAVLFAEMSGGDGDAATRGHLDRLLDALSAALSATPVS